MLHNDDQTPESPEDQKVVKSNSDLLKKKIMKGEKVIVS